jgi:type IV secretory pathway TraG/TraD family ATPase VirD4
MFVDKIKTSGLAVVVAAATTLMMATLAIIAAAYVAAVAPRKVLNFAWAEPLAAWPVTLFIFVMVAILLGLAAGISLFYFIRNYEWGYRPRDLASEKSARELIRRTSVSSPRIFGGRYGNGGREFFASVEDRGLVVGPPGTGKTAFLFNQIIRATDQNLDFVCVDIKPELHSVLAPTLMEKGYRVLRLNPALDDPAADHWNPLDDIKDETDVLELCNSLLPIRDPRDAPFTESQRDWLKAAVFHVAAQNGSLPGAFALLSSATDSSQLLKLLEASKSTVAQRLGRRLQAGLSGQKPDPLILSGLTGVLRSLDFLALPGVKAALGHSDFSLHELGKSEKPTSLFLQFEESKLGALGPVLAFLSTAVLSSLIATAGHRKPVGVFLDELGNMPPLPGLGQKLNTIRSRQMPTWMYFQTIQQIEKQYGAGASSVFLAACNFQMFFRLNDSETRELVSELVGKTTRIKHAVAKSAGSNGTSRSVTASREEVYVIQPHELGELRPGQVVTLYMGAAARGSATPHYIDFPVFKK